MPQMRGFQHRGPQQAQRGKGFQGRGAKGFQGRPQGFQGGLVMGQNNFKVVNL